MTIGNWEGINPSKKSGILKRGIYAMPSKSHFVDAVRTHLDRLQFLPPMEVLQGDTESLPVFAALHDTAYYLGHASTPSEATTLGLAHGITCERISRAALTGDGRRFYALHQ